jgi:hypothetical protein
MNVRSERTGRLGRLRRVVGRDPVDRAGGTGRTRAG